MIKFLGIGWLVFLSTFVGFTQTDKAVNNSLKYAKLGAKNFDKGQFSKSVEFYTMAIESYPEHEFNYYYRGLSYKELHEYNLAFADFDRAILFNTQSKESYWERGLLNFQFGRYKNALADFERHANLNEKPYKVQLQITKTLMQLELYKEALGVLNALITEKPNAPQAYIYRAEVYLKTNAFDRSWNDLKKSIDLGDSTTDRFIVEGKYYLSATQDGKKALIPLEKAVQLDPNSPEIHHLLSNAHHLNNNDVKAIAEATKALTIKPEAEYYYDRGCYWIEEQNTKQAMDDFTQTIALDSTYTAAYNNRTFYGWFPQKKYDLAVKDLSTVIALDSANAYAYSNRSYAYYGLGQFERAFLDAFKSVELQPKNPYVYKNLALLYHAINEDEEAKNAAMGALNWGFPVDTDPEFKALLEILGPLSE